VTRVKNAVIAWLKNQNTHRSFWVGLILGTFSIVVIGGKPSIETWDSSHLDGMGGTVNAAVEGLYIVALWIFWPALLGAAIGKPQWFNSQPPNKTEGE
jgi:hypothetical protein